MMNIKNIYRDHNPGINNLDQILHDFKIFMTWNSVNGGIVSVGTDSPKISSFGSNLMHNLWSIVLEDLSDGTNCTSRWISKQIMMWMLILHQNNLLLFLRI